MNEEVDTSQETTSESSDARIENFDFSQPDGGLVAQEDAAQVDAQAGEQSNQQTGEQAQEETEQEQGAGEQAETQLSPEQQKEHNRQAAEQRIAARNEAESNNRQFLSGLREKFMNEYVPQVDDSVYQDIEEQSGAEAADNRRKLDNLERRNAEREVSDALGQIEQTRNFIGMNIAQAESSIPLFNPNHEEYNENLHKLALEDWSLASLDTVQDEAGNVHVIGLREGAQTPIEYLQNKASVYGNILKSNAAKAQHSAQRNAQVAAPASSNVSSTKSNSLQALEDRIGDIPFAS